MTGEKTLPPTLHRLNELRRKGQVAQSRDLTQAAGFVGALLACGVALERAGRDWAARALADVKVVAGGDVDGAAALACLAGWMDLASRVVLSIMLGALLAGLAAQLLQVRPLFASKALAPDLARLDPVQGLKTRVFSLRAWVDLLKSAVKIGAVAILCWTLVRDRLLDVAAAGWLAPEASAALVAELAGRLVTCAAAAFLAIGAVDVFLQRARFLKEQRMSLQDVEREHKDQEGDPQQKARRREARKELLDQRMCDALRREGADGVVVNPTHIAVALRFDPLRGGVPRVVARGAGWVADEIREIARDRKIPIRRNVPLARALNELPPGRAVPPELLAAVGAFFRWLAERAREEGLEEAPFERRLREHEAERRRRRNRAPGTP